MNIQEDLKTYFEANPVSNFKNLAKLKSWELVNDGFDSVAFYVEGIWKNYLISLLWLEKEQQLKLTCEYDLNLPKDNISSFYKTLNLANEKCSEGHFTFCENEKVLVFHNQYKGSDALEIENRRTREIIAETTAVMDELYPVFQLISWGKETPDTALKLASHHSSGFI